MLTSLPRIGSSALSWWVCDPSREVDLGSGQVTASLVAGTWQAAPPRKGTSTLVQASARSCVARSCFDQRTRPSAPAFTQPSRCLSWILFTDGEVKGQAGGSSRMRKGTALCVLDCVSRTWNSSPVRVMALVPIWRMGNQSLDKPCGLCEAPWSSATSGCGLPTPSPAGCGPLTGPFIFLYPYFHICKVELISATTQCLVIVVQLLSRI